MRKMSYMIITRGRLVMAAVMLLAAVFAVTAVVASRPAVSASSSKRLLPIYCTEQPDKTVSISFDAAWGAEDTQMLIDIMAEHDVKATFFVVGEWVDKYPDSVKALHDAGHEIMNHSDTHPHMTNLSRDAMMKEINTCNDKIEAITGVRPSLLRPPYGDYNNALVEVLGEMGMFGIQWDVDSLDWKGLTAPEITKRVTSKVGPGSIVLFHNAAEHTPEALPDIIQTLKNDGYRFVKISEQIYKENYSIDHEGRQHPNPPAPESAAQPEAAPTESKVG